MNLTKERYAETEVPVAKKPKNELQEKVARNVLNALGTPPGFLQIKACNVYDNRWRVDIWARQKQETEGVITKTHIPDSFFCIVDDAGNLISPQIEKKY
jgi:hypothetical protein